jgi:gamma-glutamylputrescine oxidase
MSGYPPTHYAATRTDDARWPGLDGDHETETCIVGGGLAGVAAALALAERGRSVILLEAHRIGWGASGRNGGLATRGYPIAMPALADRVGIDEARALWRLSSEALAIVRRRAEALGPTVLVGHGALRCRMAEHPDSLGSYVSAMNERFNAGLVHLPAAQLGAMLATDRYADGYLNPSSLQLQPLNLARGMATTAAQHGAHLHEGAAVVSLKRRGTAWTVATKAGAVTARHVVLAGGAHLGLLHRRLGLATVPVASFVMTTEPAPERIRQAIATDAAVSDTRVATDYYRVLPDGRLLWGGRASALEPNAARLARLLRGDMARIYPQLADLKVEMAWGGLMPIARHRMPVIGPLEQGLWAAACFGGLGLVNTTLAGELIAGAIADGDDRHRHFAPFGLPFAAGSAGRAAFQFIYWRHQLGDQFQQMRRRASRPAKETP